MLLHIKQKVFSIGDKFTSTDDTGADRFYVEGEIFTFGKKLHIYNMTGREVAFLKQELFTFLPKFQILRNGEQIAQIAKRLTLFSPSYEITGLGWDVSGHFLDHDYRITAGNRTVAVIAKKWLAWSDTYTLDVPDPREVELALAVVLAIDCVLDAQQARNNSH